MKSFEIDGLDMDSNTVVVEINRAILVPMANMLQQAPDSKRHRAEAVRCLGSHLRNAAKVLYREEMPEQFNFQVFDPEDEEQQAHTGTGG